MAYTVNWNTKVITIPQADLLPLGGGIFQLNVVDFRKEVRRLLWTFGDGLYAEEAINWIPSVTIGGTPYAALLEVINGYTVTFQDLQYAVNVVGANSNIGDVTNVNQVSVRPQNSAGLINLDVLLAAAYQDRVMVDTVKGVAGTVSPVGTTRYPAKTFEAAYDIGESQGILTIQFEGTSTLNTTTRNFDGYIFQGHNREVDFLTVDTVAQVQNCVFHDMNLSGVLDGDSIVRNCDIGNLNYVSGNIESCKIIGTITLIPGVQADFINCVSGVAGGGGGQTADIDFQGSASATFRRYSGGLTLKNITGGGDISIDMEGRVVVDATCTGGTIYIRGTGNVTDNSGPGCTVVDDTVHAAIAAIPGAVWVYSAALTVAKFIGLR